MELFDQIFELKEQYDASLKPTYGIDVKEIANSKTTIKKLMKEIAAAEKTLVSLKAKQDKGLLIPVEGTTYDSIKSVVVSAIEQKTTQIKELEERIAFLEKNEVQLFEKRHLTPLEIAIEINKTALLLDLTKYLFRKPKALSGGQRQRVALGRAIVRKPKVYLMDEPLSNLDAKLRAAMRAEISKIHENTGGTTIYVTHDQVEAMTMATRIVVMKDGWIQQIGTPDEVYSDPANKFVAGFIGAPNMNFIDALVQNKQLIISDDKGKYVIDLNAKQAKCLQAYENQEITIGIRPEAIVLEKEKGDTLVSKPLELECYYAELLGSELLLHFDFFGTKITAKTEALHKIKTYDLVSICFKIEHIYFFDKETDQRIK
ncbi:MAG: ATP-binding cassette domain-containing protein [Bacilli bacterium]